MALPILSLIGYVMLSNVYCYVMLCVKEVRLNGTYMC